VENSPITDLIEYRQTMLARQQHENASVFAYVDGEKIFRVTGAARAEIELEEPLSKYDTRTLVNQALPDGTLYFSLRIDPVHPEAARQKRADTAWTDVYVLPPGSVQAVRRARLLHAGQRDLNWRASREFLAVLPAHPAFGQGGESLHLFDLR
jgi:hypothetical protein